MRHFRLPALLFIIGLASCSSMGHVTPEAVVSDLSIALDGLSTAVPALAAQKPPSIPAATADEAMRRIGQAKAALATVGPGTPAQQAGTALAEANAYLNAVLTSLAGLALPPPYGTYVTAALVLEPIIAASVQAYIANHEVVPEVKMGVRLGMSPENARATLQGAH